MKHIEVTPAEEDEVIVIGAGASGEVSDGTDAGANSDENAGESIGESATSRAAAHKDEPHKGASKQATDRKSPGNSSQKTSASNLQTPPMSLTQRIVIIAAVVCIIGAITYYFVVMS